MWKLFTAKFVATILLSGANFPSLVKSQISCGRVGHFAATCAECPQGHGAARCNGDCQWADNRCQAITRMCGESGVTADSCSECPTGKIGCVGSEDNINDNGDCAWMPSTRLCRNKFSNEVRTASVNLSYENPREVKKPAWWFQRIVPKALSDVTFLKSNAHNFGYGGIQKINENTGRVIFSLYGQGDPEDLDRTIACGTGVTCNGSRGEGPGRRSHFDSRLPLLPNENEEYYFVTQAEDVGNHRMQYTGYIYAESLGGWKLLSRIQVSTNRLNEWWLDRMHSDVEQWAAVKSTEKRAGLFGPSYVAKAEGTHFYQIPSARFNHETLENHEHVNAWGGTAEDQFAVGIETGGDVRQSATRGEPFVYGQLKPSPVLNGFKEKIPCLNGANTKRSIENCLSEESRERSIHMRRKLPRTQLRLVQRGMQMV